MAFETVGVDGNMDGGRGGDTMVYWLVTKWSEVYQEEEGSAPEGGAGWGGPRGGCVNPQLEECDQKTIGEGTSWQWRGKNTQLGYTCCPNRSMDGL